MNIPAARLDYEVARAAIESGRRVRLKCRAVGGSMWPAIRPGMRVTIETVPPEALAPGEVICYLRGEGAECMKVVHRFVRLEPPEDGRTEPTIIARGDACSREDEPFPASRLMGRIVHLAGPGPGYAVRRLIAGTYRRAASPIGGRGA